MKNNKPVFISVDGHGGSGKSTFAQKLAHQLGAQVIHIDDFTGQDAADDWYKSLLTNVIEPALAGAVTLSYSRAKWWPEHHPDPVVNQPVTPIMIIEGVCSSRNELREYLSLKVFVDTPRAICIERGLARDRGMGGKSDAEIVALWKQWLIWDDQYFAKDNPQAAADLQVDGTRPFDEAYEIIKLKLAPMTK